MRNLTVIASLMLLVSCVDFRGEYNSDKDVTFVHTTTFGVKKERTVPAGTYQTEFKLKEISNKIRLVFRTADENIKVKIKMPKGFDIPRRNGEFFLSANETGQDFDIQGTVESDRSRSRSYETTESCQYRTYRRVCRNQRVCRDNRNGQRVCRTVRRCYNRAHYRSGRREVRYHYANIQEGFKLELLEAGSNTEIATFDGRDSESERVYDYRGTCRRYGYGGNPRRPYPLN